ncbi:hypothetical protein EON83_24790 [bacterium]|nr:MAG: hypothetical protein EON83_24790 [bacterium]
MKLTVAGKLALFIIALGLGFGGWKAYQKATGGKGVSVGPAGLNGADNPSPQATSGSQQTPVTVGENELQIVTSASKRGWINDQIDKFNQTSDVKLVPKLVETREAMQQILAGRLKPALWSPSSVIWADRLSEKLEQDTGKSPLDTSDPNSYRSVMKTPIVFLTTQENARVLRPLLSSSQCWENVDKLSKGRIPFSGGFKWAHADPLNANSGMLTLALIISDYANRTGQSGAIETVANSGAFMSYLKSLESKIVYNAAVQKGSSALVKSFAEDPSRYSFITAYESAAVEAVKSDSSLAVIYPNPTVNADNAVAFLNWPELSPAQKAAGQAFLKFIAQPESAKDGLKEYFRPLRGASLNSELESLKSNGFQANYSAIELPPYAVLNGVAFKWRQEIAKK